MLRPPPGDERLRDVERGRAALDTLDASRLPDAVHLFERTIAEMPDLAPAHAALAHACFLQYETTRASNTPDRRPLLRAVQHARRACELDVTLAQGWAALGSVLAAAGQNDEARTVWRHAALLEPTWQHQLGLGLASWGEERLRACDRTLALRPECAPARFAAAMVLTARQAFGPALSAAMAGATTQSRQSGDVRASVPAIGLHWLRGLLLLRERQVGLAIEAFARELDELREAHVYAGEFRANAQIAAGFAHLAAHDATGALEAFRTALETLPRNGFALVGLYTAVRGTSLAAEARLLLPQIDQAVAEVAASQRPVEAALLRAAVYASQERLDAGCETLLELLETAPPGQAGWQIPIEPSLARLRGSPNYAQVTALLVARAA